MNDKILLTNASAIIEKYDLLNKNTGGYFNIFDITNISQNEVPICRVLYELLSPTGSHYQGNIYLKLFFEHVLKIPVLENELNSIKVDREYITSSGRKIDLVIRNAKLFIPIEVKIYAGDQKKQCYDYYMEAKKYQYEPKLYYLTRLGESPSRDSAGGLTKKGEVYEEIINISFADDILNWLDMCLKQTSTIKIAPIREIILQFIKTIQNFTGKLEKEQEMETIELIMESSKNMKTAVNIQKALPQAQTHLLEDIFKEIENDSQLKPLIKKTSNYSEKVKSFYSKGPSYPTIFFIRNTPIRLNNDSVNVTLDVGLEIGWSDIAVGYFCTELKRKKDVLLSTDFQGIKKDKKLEGEEHDDDKYTWLYSEKSLLDNECPNFKNFNDAYYALYDKEKFKEFTRDIIKRIKELIE